MDKAKKAAEEETSRIKRDAESAAEQFSSQQKESLAKLQNEKEQAEKRAQEALEKLREEQQAAESRELEAAAKLKSQQEAASKQLKQLQVYFPCRFLYAEKWGSTFTETDFGPDTVGMETDPLQSYLENAKY